jgi:hypothetical protein
MGNLDGKRSRQPERHRTEQGTQPNPASLPRQRAQRHPRVRRARQPVSVERQVMIRAEEAVEPQWPSALTAIDIRVRAGGERVSPRERRVGGLLLRCESSREARGGPC